MVSITLSVPEDIRKKMGEFEEINWSAYIRKCIVQKTEELEWKEKMLEKLKKEQGITDWAVKLGRRLKDGRYGELKKKGLL